MRRLNRAWRWLVRVQHPYLSPIERHRAGVLLLLNGVIALAALLWALLGVVSGAFQPVAAPVITVIASVLVHINIQRGKLARAVSLFVALLLVNTLLVTVFANFDQLTVSGTAIIILMIPIVAAGVLLNRQGILIIALVIVAALALGAISQSANDTPTQFIPSQVVGFDLVSVGVTVAITTGFLLVFSNAANRITQTSLMELRQRQWVAEYAIDIGQEPLAVSVVLARALTLLHGRFGYSFVQIYRYDDDQNLLVRTMSSGLGQSEAADRGGYGLNEMNAISECARTRQPVAVVGGAPGSAHLRPAMRYGLAMPVLHQGRLLAVLDIQRTDDTPLPPTQVETLTLLAGHIGVGMTNAVTAGDMQRHLDEQVAENTRLQKQLAEFHNREQRRVSRAWSSYLQGRGKTAIGYDIQPGQDIVPIAAHNLPEDLRRTLEQGSLHVETRGDEKIIHVPITFRNQTFGAMAFRIPASQELTNRQIEMAQVVAERLAIALENMRLFEQSQAQALRERKAGQITEQLIGTKDVDALLNLAAESFNDVLGAVHTRIYVQPDLLAEPPLSREEATR
ncbi:MAG: GAF domain-containing protein [Chloroflexi bacterium]|nr:GAF domain-containing protein [Chloroflexota bacterium]